MSRTLKAAGTVRRPFVDIILRQYNSKRVLPTISPLERVPNRDIKKQLTLLQEIAMSAPRGRVSNRYTITIIAIILSLTVVVSLCTLLTFPRAQAAPIVSDNFNDNSLDTTKWGTTLFSGFTNTSLGLNETSNQLQIGPLLQNTGSSNYRGVRTNSTYNFSGAYAYVELVQAPNSSTAADAMLTIGNDVDNYYRIYVSAGSLIGLKKIGGTKTTLFTITYNSTNHRFLRIRHDSSTGNVTLDTATGSSGVPGSWVN